jgi:hypothetical protein
MCPAALVKVIAVAGGTPLNAMLEATTTSGAMLRWVMHMLKPAKDTIFLTRGSAFDVDHKLLPSAKRVFDTYRLQLSQASFEHQLRPCAEVPRFAFPKVRACGLLHLLHLVQCLC